MHAVREAIYNNRNAFPSSSHYPTAAVEYVNHSTSRQSDMIKPVCAVFFFVIRKQFIYNKKKFKTFKTIRLHRLLLLTVMLS